MFFWLGPKEPKTQDAAKLQPRMATAGPLLRRPTAPFLRNFHLKNYSLNTNTELCQNSTGFK